MGQSKIVPHREAGHRGYGASPICRLQFCVRIALLRLYIIHYSSCQSQEGPLEVMSQRNLLQEGTSATCQINGLSHLPTGRSFILKSPFLGESLLWFLDFLGMKTACNLLLTLHRDCSAAKRRGIKFRNV